MKCLSPISIKRPGSKETLDRIVVPCGKCYACLARHRASWVFRLNQEFKYSSTAYFLTLTYDDDNLPISPTSGNPVFNKRDVQLFFKSLREEIRRIFGITGIRYFLVSEYGGQTLRPHYHCLLFNLPLNLDVHATILQSWKLGFVSVSPLTSKRINYACKYILADSDLPKDYQSPFIMCSKRPAIGSQYLTPEMVKHHLRRKEATVRSGNFLMSMPRYYRDKIFTTEHLKAQVKSKTLSYVLERDRQKLESLGLAEYVKDEIYSKENFVRAARKAAKLKREP